MPKKKKYKIRTGARTAAKVQEKELITKAKKIKKNPGLVIPKCEHEGRCPLDRVRRQVDRVRMFSDDEKRLTKLAGSGDQLARAYAATLLVAQSEKAPYLAVFRTPFGEIAYALRGKVKKEKLIGVQHYDKPKWRFLSLVDLATKKGLHIYYTKSGLVCKGRDPKPPENFVKDVIADLKYNLKKEGKIYTCEHIQPKDIEKGEVRSHTYLLVNWKAADRKIAVCVRCATKKINMVAQITQNMAVPKPEGIFAIDVVNNVNCQVECKDCNLEKRMDIDEKMKESYINGTHSDYGLVEKHMEKYQEFIGESEKKLYIMDEDCYGEDMNAFIDALKPTDYERVGLLVILKKVEEPVVVLKATPNKVLNMFWEDYGQDAIKKIVGDEKTAKKIFEKADITKSSPSQILKEATVIMKERDIISALPTYSSLPPIAKFADNIARIFMTQGKEDALRAIEHYRGGDTRIKSVAYSFLLALDQGASKKWQYTKTEIDFAQFLKDPAHRLLKSKPGEYHENLQSLLSATGSTKQLSRN
jgi:hypothetical protein